MHTSALASGTSVAHFGTGTALAELFAHIAVEGHGVPADMEPFHTTEYLLSTMAFLTFMCRWQCTANLASTRLAAKQMFGDIVRLVFDGDPSFNKELVGFGIPPQLGHGQARCRKASKLQGLHVPTWRRLCIGSRTTMAA